MGSAGNFSEGIFLSSGADWLRFIFHPGFEGGAFRIAAYDGTTTGNLNLGFTPAMETLHHIAVDYDGEGQFDVTFTDGDDPANAFNYHYEDTRLDGSMLMTGLYSSGTTVYAEVWYYDNWIIDAVPEPSTPALLLSILLSALFVRIKQRKGANA